MNNLKKNDHLLHTQGKGVETMDLIEKALEKKKIQKKYTVLKKFTYVKKPTVIY